MKASVLAIDLGTSSVRTALFDFKAKRVRESLASESYRVHYSADGGAELDPATLLRATKSCLRKTSRLTNGSIHAIAGSGFWHSLLGLNHDDQAITPIYTWADARCSSDATHLRERFDERQIHRRTGCMLRSSFWPAKLFWLRRTQPELFHRVARWVSPPQWIFEEIFQARACSHSMASGTGLYDLVRRNWDAELLGACGLTTSQLDMLADKISAQYLTVCPPIGDGAASNLGSGASSSRVVAINIGTSAAVRAICSSDAAPPFGLFRYAVDRRRSVIGGAISNAGNLHAWCLRALHLPNDAAKIEKLLRESGEASNRLTILPFWVNERAPTWPENLDGVITGLTQATTAADLLRATTAAYSNRLADILERLETAIGRAKRIIVSGGILQSPASLQILADSLGRDLQICVEQEASLRGAAVHALNSLGERVSPLKRGKQIRHNKRNSTRARNQRQRQVTLEELFTRLPLARPQRTIRA